MEPPPTPPKGGERNPLLLPQRGEGGLAPVQGRKPEW